MDSEGVKEIAELARRDAEVQWVEETSVRDEPVPLGSLADAKGETKFVSIKKLLDEWRTAPERVKGTATAFTIKAFTDLVNRHKSEHTAIFGNLDPDAPYLLAVVDYHKIDHAPAWAQHLVRYDFPLSDEWKTWSGADGRMVTQGEWAAFVEDNIADLSAPYDQERTQFEDLFKTKFAAPSELVTLSRGMTVLVEARVKEVRTLQSGECEVVYEEAHKDGGGKALKVPGLFVVSIPLFVGAAKERVICRLRYRKVESRIMWAYQMYRPEVVVREYLERTLAEVGDETALPVFEGAPEQ